MTDRHRALMIGHGTLVVFLGLAMGYLFLFNLIGEITLWPIPGSLRVQIPGDVRGWRAAHTGNIMNGLMAIAVGLSLPHLRLSAASERFVVWGLILTIWGNVGFYVLSALGAAGRGLTLGPNKFGGGDPLSVLAFLVGYPGAFLAPVAVLLIARGAFTAARAAGTR
ncbi:MAG: styrene-oxide isomerase StyC [Candidatus Binatia bacterium]